MQHVAIMRKSWGLLPKILAGQKTIESRWYLHRSAPWNKIQIADEVYFKNSGEPITLKANVARVLQFANLSPAMVADLLQKYGEQDGLAAGELPQYYNLFKYKKYCLLIFLKNAEPVEPFRISKQGYGAMAAWMTVPSIQDVKLHN